MSAQAVGSTEATESGGAGLAGAGAGIELIDELEAGELSVEFEGRSPRS